MAIPGDCQLLLHLKTKKNCEILSLETSLTLTIATLTELYAAIDISNPLIKMPQNAVVNLLLANKGNDNLSLIIRYSDTSNDCILFEDSVNLIPGENQSISKSFATENLPNTCNQLNVHIEIFHAANYENLFSRIASFELIKSNFQNAINPYITLPAHLRLMTMQQNGQHTQAFEFAGKGIINTERQTFADFCLRIPSNPHNVAYSEYQRIYLGLSEPSWNVDLGDAVYALTPLTEFGRYSRGAGINVSTQKLSAGGFFSKNIFHNCDNIKEGAGYIGYDVNRFIYTQANYFYLKKYQHKQSNIGTLEVAIEPFDSLSVTLEGARNFHSKYKLDKRNAWRIDARGSFKQRCWYYAEKIHADPCYFGYYNDIDQTACGINFAITPCLQANASLNNCKQNMHCNTQNNLQRLKQKQYNAQVSYSFNNGFSINANTLLLHAHDGMWASNYNFSQHWDGVNANYSHNKFSWNLSCSFGETRDHLNHEHHKHLQRFSLYNNWFISNHLSISIQLEAGNINYFDPKPWRNLAGVYLRYNRDNCFSLQAYARTMKNFPNGIRDNQIGVLGHYFQKNGNRVGINLEYFHQKANSHATSYPKHMNNFWFFVDYTIPLCIPIHKRNDIGCANGMIYDHATNAGIADVLVNLNGHRTYTDEHGYYAFHGIPNGDYFMKCEVLPSNLITSTLPDIPISITGGKTCNVNVMCLSPATYRGKVVLFDYKNDDLFKENNHQLMEKGPISSVLITIENKESREVYSTITNNEGCFSFNYLRPGIWHVNIFTDSLPSHIHLPSTCFEVSLKADEDHNTTIKAVPIVRPIQWQED